MTNSEVDARISRLLRTATYPVAIKLTHDPVPDGIKTARQGYKRRLALCQGVSLARKVGRITAFEPEDHACPIFCQLFGMGTVPEFVDQGAIVHPIFARDLEAGKRTASKEFRLAPGIIRNIILAPLHLADFTPDVLLIYGNGAQMSRLVQGALFNSGGIIHSSSMGRGGCVNAVGLPYTNKECTVVIPSGGERLYALTGDDELCFALPGEKINDTMEGLKATHDNGVARMPTPFLAISAAPVYPKSYRPLLDHYGLD